MNRHDDRTRDEAGTRSISPALIGFVVVAVLAVVFFLQNGDDTEIELWVFTWDTTVRWSLLVAMALGVLLDRLFVIWRRRRRRG